MSRSRLTKPAIDTLGVACYFSLAAPWFLLIARVLREPLVAGVFWRLAALVLSGMVLSRLSKRYADSLATGEARKFGVAVGAAGLLLSYAVVVRPLLALSAAAGASPGGGVARLWLLWLMAGAVFWLLGVRAGVMPPDNNDMRWHMPLGSLSLGACLLIASRTGYENFMSDALPYLVFWSFAVLVAMALTRLSELDTKGGTQSPDIAKFWPPLLVAVAAACLVIALALSVGAPLLLWLMRGPFRLLLRVAEFGLMLFAYAVGLILQALVWLYNLIAIRRGLQQIEPPPPFEPKDIFPETETRGLTPAIGEIAKWTGLTLIVLGTLAVAAYYLLRRYWKPSERRLDEFRESFASREAFGRWAQQRWASMLASLGRAAKQLMAAQATPQNAREMYLAVLSHASKKCTSLPAQVTPHRFQPALYECFPKNTRETDLLLGAFAAEYYADERLSADALRDARRAYEAIIVAKDTVPKP